jgi:uncharacterized protein (TIGR03435 family)
MLAGGVALSYAAQVQGTDGRVSFDAATIKLEGKATGPLPFKRKRGGPGTSDPGRILWFRQNLISLICAAWGVEFYQVTGPSWLLPSPDAYDLTATMAPDTTQQKLQLMLQDLLAERFRLQVHHETKNFPGYELVVAPGGPKLKPAANPDSEEQATNGPGGEGPDGFPVLTPGHGSLSMQAKGGAYFRYQSFQMPEFASALRFWVQQATGAELSHIVDRTGLKGKYDFTLKFDTSQNNTAVTVGPRVQATIEAQGGAGESTPSGLPGIFKAVDQQLGLKLVKNAKGFPLDVVVIDHLEMRPVE